MLSIKIPEEYLLTIQKFDLEQTTIRSKIKKIETETVTFSIKSNTQCELTIPSGKLLTANWQWLGKYDIITNPETSDKLYNWAYPWVLMEDPALNDYKTQIDNIFSKNPDLQVFGKNILQSADPMMISFILAILHEELKLQYIHYEVTENSYNAFGLKDLVWEEVK